METNLSANYVINNDIDCSDTVNWNSGNGFVPIYVFAGTFDGQGYKIAGLFINGPMAPPPFNARLTGGPGNPPFLFPQS